ncbi:uncharacterized protein [Physcomitrium patens]|uniref:DnaJ-like protein n=1 Tax=Physcomitrium patens TaxID=3218 RepID=A0A2K1J2F6_PHYPA|nr:dnaJ homolog subfamily C member 2-like [Physcomitrium patens]XP_024401148.1 dnaJ homolog subfamily C member 2-like [Physcomitrium patens]XP_024401149.1 dnaJ homolog subfamily C member 2-like [Physcomitrium patens]XP_024401150.1 dnaJ homolog subfamily C member 2-like [Physcomitrium patens]XP_024401151.1 dnaJ homolog subfamily C member 2-like [Physcomitrium patens]PNR35701.1 hypothetical protein PHYPA_021551 [Physcomitrium patens]|eukprot:XP_024401147.1 dnaJ homolog subfamily C member 2-like [Physcomitrella patens]
MPGREDRLSITYFAADIPEVLPEYVASNNKCYPRVGLEPAGMCFHEAAKRTVGVNTKPAEEEEEVVPDTKDKESDSPSADSYGFKGKKSGDGAENQDHYALLGLSHLRFLATEDQIRKSYREAALKHHPDKHAALLLTEETEEKKEIKKDEIDQHFKAIQLAYEVLIDPVKRRAYDSTDEFDDEVPSDCAPGDFFKVFGSVFARNARWSTIQPVPFLGDNDTDMASVDSFYDFWWSFKSWREFPHADDFDLEEAESREHKRWMERQNAKLREKARKEENARIRLLTDNAYKKDPRIIARKEMEKAEKLRKKQAKSQARREKEEEAARALEEERLRKEEEDRKAAEEASALKKLKEKEKKLLRREKARLRGLTASAVAKGCGISDSDVDMFCTSLEISRLRGLCEKLEGMGDVEEQVEYLRKVISGEEMIISSDSAATGTPTRVNSSPSMCTLDATPSKTHAKKTSERVAEKVKRTSTPVTEERPWSKQEVDLLRKAVQKFPKGTSQRWEVIANYMRSSRSADEIVKAVKTVLVQKPNSSKAFDSSLQKNTGNVVTDSPLLTKENEGGYPQTCNGTAGGEKSQENGASGRRRENGAELKNVTPGIAQSDGTVPNGGPAEGEEWSEAQEVALVNAIKAFPKDTVNRWDRIATSVPGKSKAQCLKKFAGLRDSFRSSKKV